MSLKKNFALEQELASLGGHLSAVVPTSPLAAESRLDSVHEELVASNAMIGKLQAVV